VILDFGFSILDDALGKEHALAEPIGYGKYIVADPRSCHGTLTFRGTRIMVKSIVDCCLVTSHPEGSNRCPMNECA
jgi:hypothetical protein